MALSPSPGRRPGLHPALSTRQRFALLEEAGSVRQMSAPKEHPLDDQPADLNYASPIR